MGSLDDFFWAKGFTFLLLMFVLIALALLHDAPVGFSFFFLLL